MDIMLQRILSLIPDRHGADAEFARSLGYKSGKIGRASCRERV